MDKIKQYLGSFSKRGGFHIFFSTIFLRIIQFVLGVLIIRLLSKDDYGNLSYALTITQLIIPFSGAGLYLSLLHFGSIQESIQKKVELFNFTLKRGFVYSILIMISMFALSGLVAIKMPGSVTYLRLFIIYIMSYYLFYTAISYLRIMKKNKAYAMSLLLNSILVFVLSLIGVFVAKGTGYIIGFSIAPLITGTIVLIAIKKKADQKTTAFFKSNDLSISKKDYTKYGMFSGLGNIASQMAWQLDTIMIGIILAQSDMVATYKVAALIPFSLVFLPSVFMQTDFVYIAEKYKDRSYLLNYYKKYFVMFFIITSIILSVWYGLGTQIIKLFGPEYLEAQSLINILMINVATTFLFRVPLGNILAAVGKAKWNSYSAITMLFINLILNYILIPQYGIFGAAYATVLSIGLSSIIALILFIKYLNELTGLGENK